MLTENSVEINHAKECPDLVRCPWARKFVKSGDLVGVHLRKSNTEPILRIYAEAGSPEAARRLADTFAAELQELLASTGA